MEATVRIPAALLALCLASAGADEAGGSESTLRPAVSVSAGYTDNVFLSPTNRMSDSITRVEPSLQFTHVSPLWDWNVEYAYDYRLYAHKTVENDSTQRIKFANRTRIVPEFLLLDVLDRYDRVSLTPVRDYTKESITVNQTDRNDFAAIPSLRLRPADSVSVKAGYRYRSLWYDDPSALDKVERGGYAEGAWDLSSRTSLLPAVGYTGIETNALEYHKTDLSIRAKYEYREDSFLDLTLGASWFTSGRWQRAGQTFWGLEISRKLPSSALSFRTSLDFVDDPLRILRRKDRYEVSLRKKMDRLQVDITAGVWEFRKIVTNYLQDVRTGMTALLSYSFTPMLEATYGLTIERFDNKEREAQTGREEYESRYVNELRLEYGLSETVTLSGDYGYTNNYAPHSPENNYYNNWVRVKLSKRL